MTENGKKIKTERAFPAKMRGRLAAHFRKYRWNYLFSVLAVAVMWGVWVAAYFAVGNEYVVPSFTETMRELGALFASGTFWESFGGTLWRTVAGWLLAFAFAVLFAAAGVASKSSAAFSRPLSACSVRCRPWRSPSCSSSGRRRLSPPSSSPF